MEGLDNYFWGWDTERLDNCEYECQKMMKKYGITLEEYPDIPNEAREIATDLLRGTDNPLDALTEIIVYAKFITLLNIIYKDPNVDLNKFDMGLHDPHPRVCLNGKPIA